MSRVDTTVNDEDSLVELKVGLDAGRVHLGREETTLALASVVSGASAAFPILCLARFKASCPELGKKIFRLVRFCFCRRYRFMGLGSFLSRFFTLLVEAY